MAYDNEVDFTENVWHRLRKTGSDFFTEKATVQSGSVLYTSCLLNIFVSGRRVNLLVL
jgi:hypothetical protein